MLKFGNYRLENILDFQSIINYTYGLGYLLDL